MGTALVVGLLIAVCGGIAYVGDLLGRRMGKKRLTLFGLRPRHTAVVFTVITGMVIAAVTLAVLMGVSDGVRRALTQGERLLLENRKMKQERLNLAKASRALTERNYDLDTRNKSLRHEATQLQTSNRDLQARNTTLDQRNKALLAGNSTLTRQNRQLTEQNQQLTTAKRQLAGTNDKLRMANSELQRRNRGLQVAQAGLKKANRLAQQQLTAAYQEGKQTEQRALNVVIGLRKEATALQKQVNELRLQTARATERATELEVGQVVVRAREELARRVLPPGVSEADVRRTIEALLDDADAEVARRERPHGIQRESGARPRRVRLALPGGSRERLLARMVTELMTESHPIDGRVPARTIRERHPLVVRAVARANVAAGSEDPVAVDVVGRINRLAFRKGQEVASMEVAAANTSGQLLKTLVAFLQQQVRDAALARSVLPDAHGQVGEIDPEALLDVVARIRRLPGHVRIGAVAGQETWSAGPLQLDFYVVPAETQLAEEKAE